MTIVKNKKEVANKAGVLLGAIESITTPITREDCTTAATYIDHAIQVRLL